MKENKQDNSLFETIINSNTVYAAIVKASSNCLDDKTSISLEEFEGMVKENLHENFHSFVSGSRLSNKIKELQMDCINANYPIICSVHRGKGVFKGAGPQNKHNSKHQKMIEEFASKGKEYVETYLAKELSKCIDALNYLNENNKVKTKIDIGEIITKSFKDGEI